MADVIRNISIIAAGIGFAIGLATAAHAQPYPSFRVSRIGSSQDGSLQLVELEEVANRDGQSGFAYVLRLEVTYRAGITKRLDFSANLPNPRTAGQHVVIATPPLPRDFALPEGFLPTDGGTLALVVCDECIYPNPVDTWSFDVIPTDGRLLERSGQIESGSVRTFAGETFACCAGAMDAAGRRVGVDLRGVEVFEYYNARLDHYFISGSQPDIDALDWGRNPGWTRIDSFPALSTRAAYYAGPDGVLDPVPVCRFYIPSGSHFFSASQDECRLVARQHPEYVLETDAAFYAVLPDLETGKCPSPIIYAGLALVFERIYRLWNARPDTNHRYTHSQFLQYEMIKQGWKPEGYGPDGVGMCVGRWESAT